ncbi:MAG: hypothetical protein IJK87_07570 [Prevotella sp.]|nr:hypothetical protein [Prevotella sp.]
MKNLKYFISLLVLCIITTNVQAQNESELTESQKREFRLRVKQKVEEFQNGLKKIVNNELSRKARTEHVANTLQLFIGEGEKYSYYDEELDRRIESNGVKMQTSSVNQERTQSQLLKKYIYKLYDPSTGKSSLPYTKIQIDSASAVRVDNIYKVGDHYECVAYFAQKFIGYRDGKVWYSDKTGKKIRCFIRKIDLPTGEALFEAKLGDIYVLYTERLFR